MHCIFGLSGHSDFSHSNVKYKTILSKTQISVLGLYRLDRLTSGVFIMAKTAEFAAKVMKDIAGRNVQKEYVARVVGYFPE